MPTMLERARTAGIPVHEFDLVGDDRWGRDPHAVWDEATSIAPLFYSPVNRGFFVAADYATVLSVLRNTDVWGSTGSPFVYSEREIPLSVPPITMDPPVHTQYRNALIPLFSPKVLDPLEHRIHDITRELIDDVVAKGSCEFNRDFGSQLPSRFFLSWMGFENRDDYDRMFHLAEMATFDFPTPEARRAIDEEIRDFVRDLFDARRATPTDDLASALVQLEVDGATIEPETLVHIGANLFTAGQDTTATQLGYIMFHLAQHREHRQMIIDDPSLIPSAIEELMRVYNTGGSCGRNAKAAGELNGVPIEPGDRIFIARSGADRALFEGIDLRRSPNRHMAFGLGIHRCIGSHIARVEMRVALEMWHERIPEYSIAPDFEETHRYGAFMQQLSQLPLVLGAS